MLILALDGALGPLTAAVLDSATDAAWVEQAAAGDALEDGLRAVDAALREAGTTPRQLRRLAVTVGPGGFTGLRIALTYAKSLAFALAIPLVGVSSFDALAPVAMAPPALVAVRGRAGAACVRLRLGDGEQRRCDTVAAVASWVRERVGPAQPLVACGSLDELAPALRACGLAVSLLAPEEPPVLRAARLAAKASDLSAAGAHGVQPDYGERPHINVSR